MRTVGHSVSSKGGFSLAGAGALTSLEGAMEGGAAAVGR